MKAHIRKNYPIFSINACHRVTPLNKIYMTYGATVNAQIVKIGNKSSIGWMRLIMQSEAFKIAPLFLSVFFVVGRYLLNSFLDFLG